MADRDDPPTVADVDVVLLASPRGFCAGVEMAIKALAWMVRAFEAPVYSFVGAAEHEEITMTWREEAAPLEAKA